ncbi:hypothetical protein ML462_15505 [Gramella lutea]|uniref:Uncharacterized protein n=1 Tax=Christiangramia lutea TaxID=1607951 RepID=A0A9X1V7S0_9FLAO|nr:hypothetical protein [Christiangramia lutea]MCH4824579.1 hypothetical protein [Christiangramia lutea]
MKRILSLVIFLTFINCTDKIETVSGERNVFILHSENPKEEKFNFKIDKKKDFSSYEYVSQDDTSKTVLLNFKKENQIFLGTDEFKILDKKPVSFTELSEKEFHFYNLKDPMDDGTGPLLFNQEYGLLAIYNVYGPIIIFLEDSDKTLYDQVLKALRE